MRTEPPWGFEPQTYALRVSFSLQKVRGHRPWPSTTASLFRLVRSMLVEQCRAARSGSPHPSLLVGDGPKRLLPMIRGHFGGTLIDWPGVAQIILIKAQRPARHTGLGSVSIHEPRHDDRAVMFVIPVLRSGTSAGDVPT
jgi:hypothetical protein